MGQIAKGWVDSHNAYGNGLATTVHNEQSDRQRHYLRHCPAMFGSRWFEVCCAKSPHSPIDHRDTAPQLDELTDAWRDTAQPNYLGDFRTWLLFENSISDKDHPNRGCTFRP
jgi:hypothetical protein